MSAESLTRYNDTHPINEEEILAELRARGDDSDRQEQLKDFDQDHDGGTAAVDALAQAAGIVASHHVLDVCCGLGGPARWLAFTRGCRVTALDLTLSRVESARRLSARAGLADKVRFEHGDATAMPFADRAFDAVIGQKAWVHVPDKAALLSEARRVLRDGGCISFTDIVERAPLPQADRAQMANEMQFAQIASPAQYRALLHGSGFRIEDEQDLSARWTQVLEQRLLIYRSLKDTTVARFGAAHDQHWERMYAAFVALYQRGLLGGVRFLARAAA